MPMIDPAHIKTGSNIKHLVITKAADPFGNLMQLNPASVIFGNEKTNKDLRSSGVVIRSR